MKRKTRTNPSRLIVGELYLFHSSDLRCPSISSLWGVFDTVVDRLILLELSTEDLQEFRLWRPLPEKFAYARRATRSELRDYVSDLTLYQWYGIFILPPERDGKFQNR